MPSAFSPSFPLWEESFMKVSHLLVISLLVVGALFVPAVSATYEEVLTDSEIISKDYSFYYSSYWEDSNLSNFAMLFANIEDWADINGVLCRNDYVSFGDVTLANSQDGIPHYVDFIVSGTNDIVGNGYLTYNILYDSNNDPSKAQFWVDFNEWNIEGLTGAKTILLQLNPDSPLNQIVM